MEIEDIICPYCGKYNEVCNDDGHGIAEDTLYQDECIHCEKSYVFTSRISMEYYPKTANCLNGSEHEYKETNSYPKYITRMECITCEEIRSPTEKEWFDILPSYYIEWGL